MIKKSLLFMIACALVMAFIWSLQLNSSSDLSDAEWAKLPALLQEMAAYERDKRLRMHGRTWVYFAAGNSNSVTDGDVARAKVALAMRGSN